MSVCISLASIFSDSYIPIIRGRVYRFSSFLLLALVAGSVVLAGCGSGTPKTTTTTTPPPPTGNPPPPSVPSTPPVPITWSPQTSPLPAPPAQTPPPAASNDFPLTISSPSDGTTVTLAGHGRSFSKSEESDFLYAGLRRSTCGVLRVLEFDQHVNLDVSRQAHSGSDGGRQSRLHFGDAVADHRFSFAISNHGERNPGHARVVVVFRDVPDRLRTRWTDLCRWLGTAVSTITQGQSTPSMDGKAAKFSMGGPTPYSNILYYNPIGGGDSVSHFSYDLYFYIDTPGAAQALEFDLNQTFGGTRWVWGSECNFNGSGKWDIWDDINGWKPTSIDCKPFPAATWIHLV